jgi:hypothetical protein
MRRFHMVKRGIHSAESQINMADQATILARVRFQNSHPPKRESKLCGDHLQGRINARD